MVTDLADSFWKSVRTEWQELQRRFVEKNNVCGDKAGSGTRRGREVAMRIPLYIWAQVRVRSGPRVL